MTKIAFHKNDEVEVILHRITFPGKNTGWLGVGEHSNVWLITRNLGYWITQLNGLAEDMADANKRASRTSEIRKIAHTVMDTDGSLEKGFELAASGLRDGRAGYQIVDVGDVDPTDRMAVMRALERKLLQEYIDSRKEREGSNG